MASITNDQYFALAALERWYRKYQHQVIEISGVIGTGVWEVVQKFISLIGFDPREVMYLSYDQKQVIEMAAKRYHSYYVEGIIYKYTKIVDFNTLPVINDKSSEVKSTWKKSVRKRLPDDKYQLMIVFDSLLLNEQTLRDLMTFGIPIILIRDPALIPAPDSYTYMRDPNISLQELHSELMKYPVTYFANKILNGDPLGLGNYDSVSIVPKKQLNLYNFKSADMILTLSNEMSSSINRIYREKVMNIKNNVNVVNERLIVTDNMYGEKLVNEDEKKIKVYLTKGVVGTISRCNKHAPVTRYIPIDFKTDFYFDPFEELMLDRYYLNGVETPSRQQIPDEIFKTNYAYALSAHMARLSHWDKVTIIADKNEVFDPQLQRYMLYTLITRSHHSITMVI